MTDEKITSLTEVRAKKALAAASPIKPGDLSAADVLGEAHVNGIKAILRAAIEGMHSALGYRVTSVEVIWYRNDANELCYNMAVNGKTDA